MRVLMLDDDNHVPSYHCEDTTKWYDANEFIKWLTKPHTAVIPYEVKQLYLIDVDYEKLDRVDYFFDVVFFEGKGHSFEEYQEAFNFLWEIAKEI